MLTKLETLLSLTAIGTVVLLTATDHATSEGGDAPLTRIYAGEDGGAFYLRAVGSEVFGFGEHPGRGYALVLKGTVSGDRINGQ